MTQFAPVVLKDRHTPQVDHTFNPRGIEGGIATLVESVSGVPLADRRITIGQVRSANGRVKVTLKVALPVVQDVTVGGVTKPTIVRTAYADVTFNFDQASTTQERDDCVGFVEGLLAWTDNDMMMGTIVDLQGIY
jgi:hypothetical protein